MVTHKPGCEKLGKDLFCGKVLQQQHWTKTFAHFLVWHVGLFQTITTTLNACITIAAGFNKVQSAQCRLITQTSSIPLELHNTNPVLWPCDTGQIWSWSGYINIWDIIIQTAVRVRFLQILLHSPSWRSRIGKVKDENEKRYSAENGQTVIIMVTANKSPDHRGD